MLNLPNCLTLKGINLGRLHNKYLIIEIFSFSADGVGEEETEGVLWISSRRHRHFLPRNHTWYPRYFDTKQVWRSLKQLSNELESLKQAKFLFDHIRIYGKREVTKVTFIYTAS